MSELREEIERQFKTQGLIASEVADETEPAIEIAPADGIIPDETPSETHIEESHSEIAAVNIPPEYQGKFASEFKNLPEDWQIFLCEREAQTEQKIKDFSNKLDAFNALEIIFGTHRKRLQEKGFRTMQDWLQGLAWLDVAMDENPLATLQAVATVYGINFAAAKQEKSDVSPEVIARVCKLERSYHNLTSYLQEMQNRNLLNTLLMFGRQTDSNGNLLHPYFNEVKEQVYDLLKSGTAVNPEEAYNNALWLNPSVRKELIQKQINSEAAEAEKAKKAAFALKGKSEAPQRELTLREELEKNMAALIG